MKDILFAEYNLSINNTTPINKKQAEIPHNAPIVIERRMSNNSL